jgi:hypothetical protein
MSVETLRTFYVRDLNKAAEEVEKYDSDDALWRLADGIGNSGGNLGLHLAGNINHFIGAVLGNTGYIRDRDLEFSDKGISREELAAKLRGAAEVADEVFASMSDDDLATDYPEEFLGEIRSTDWILAQMLSHLNYHLGQINYHRRLVG